MIKKIVPILPFTDGTNAFKPGRLYGFSYHNPNSFTDVYYLIPINYLVKIVRGIKFRSLVLSAARSDKFRRIVLWYIKTRHQGGRKD